MVLGYWLLVIGLRDLFLVCLLFVWWLVLVVRRSLVVGGCWLLLADVVYCVLFVFVLLLLFLLGCFGVVLFCCLSCCSLRFVVRCVFFVVRCLLFVVICEYVLSFLFLCVIRSL